MNSGTVLAGTDGCTSITLGTTIMPATGAMSRMKLKLSFSYNVVLMAFAAVTRRSVQPSAGARTTASVAILGSRLIKFTIQEQRRGRQRPDDFAPACRSGLRCA